MEEGQKEINLREHWPQKAWDGKEKYEVKIMKYERISHKRHKTKQSGKSKIEDLSGRHKEC
jgi:hypothetical protein